MPRTGGGLHPMNITRSAMVKENFHASLYDVSTYTTERNQGKRKAPGGSEPEEAVWCLEPRTASRSRSRLPGRAEEADGGGSKKEVVDPAVPLTGPGEMEKEEDPEEAGRQGWIDFVSSLFTQTLTSMEESCQQAGEEFNFPVWGQEEEPDRPLVAEQGGSAGVVGVVSEAREM